MVSATTARRESNAVWVPAFAGTTGIICRVWSVGWGKGAFAPCAPPLARLPIGGHAQPVTGRASARIGNPDWCVATLARSTAGLINDAAIGLWTAESEMELLSSIADLNLRAADLT
jgi:hypothetical protein